MATERSSLLQSNGNGGGDISKSSLFEATSKEELDNAIYWFELSQTNFAPEQAPMWKASTRSKPEDLGVSESLWKAFSDDLSTIYRNRRRILWIGYVIALLLAWPVSNLLFASRWWMIAVPAVLFGIFLRHELQFTSDCYIPLSSANEDSSDYYAPFHHVCAKYEEELASHGVRATVMADEEGSSPQRAYLIFAPTIETGSEGLYFV